MNTQEIEQHIQELYKQIVILSKTQNEIMKQIIEINKRQIELAKSDRDSLKTIDSIMDSVLWNNKMLNIMTEGVSRMYGTKNLAKRTYE